MNWEELKDLENGTKIIDDKYTYDGNHEPEEHTVICQDLDNDSIIVRGPEGVNEIHMDNAKYWSLIKKEPERFVFSFSIDGKAYSKEIQSCDLDTVQTIQDQFISELHSPKLHISAAITFTASKI